MLRDRRFRSSNSRQTFRAVVQLAVGVVIVALGLRTWLVQGLIEPVTVSGGSMAEAWRGPHRQVACDDCGFEFACGLERLASVAVCPVCGYGQNDLERLPDLAGDAVWIDRAAFARRGPRRWETVVLRCPEQARAYCLKRVVGLPGERVEIRDGDVYIHGEIARKSLDQTRALAHLVHDAAYRSRRGRPSAARWQPAQPDSAWRESSAGGFVWPTSRITKTPASPDWLVFHPRDGGPLTDDDTYNPGESRRLNPIRDLLLTLHVKSRAGEFRWRICDGPLRFEVRVDLPRGELSLWRDDEQLATRATDARRWESGCPVELALIDGRLLLSVDGAVEFAWEYELPDRRAASSAQPVAIGAVGGEIELAEVRLWRDIYYTDPGWGHARWGLTGPVQLADDELFVLGDNSPISADSRLFERPGVFLKLLVGKPLLSD